MVSGAGETSTHSVVICRLIVDGRPQGLEWFIVPLRSRSTGRPLPGVVVGNIGTKGGLHGLDNGWIQFNQVRIPRENMLMRWSQLDANGVYTPAAHPAFAYVALISERLSITATANRNYACALTIAVRYCCARRQGRRNEQLLDYTIQQQRLMPGIASLYVYSLAVLQFQAEWQQLLDEAYEQPEKHATLFPAAHGLSSGLKSTISWWGSNVLESCRRACGAHAYSEYNGLTIWIKETSPLTSGGGDSTLLGQLAAKFLLTSLRKAAAGERLVGAVAYLNDMDRILANPPQHDRPTGHFTSPDILLKMLTWISVRQICTMAELLTVSDNVDPEDRWNELQADLVIATNMHVQRHSLQNFLVHIRSTSAHDQYASLQPVLERCATLFALQCVREHLAAFLEFGYFSSADAEAVRTAFREMCLALRQDALPLVDAWAFPDFVLKSGVGRYDGDAYQGFFNLLRQSPNCCGVPSYWQDHIRPLTHPDAE